MRQFAIVVLVAALIVPAAALTASGAPSSKDLALLATLRKQRLTKIEFKETDLKGIVKWLRIATSKNILIKKASLAKAGVEWEDLRWTVQLEKVTVWTFLSEVVCKPHGMAVKVKGNIVFVTSKADSYGKAVTKLYGISHITWTKTDFIAPEINLTPSGFTGDEYEPEIVREDDPLNNGDAVADLIKELILPKGWENNDDWTIKASNTYLIIRAPKSVHRLIPRALAKIASMK